MPKKSQARNPDQVGDYRHKGAPRRNVCQAFFPDNADAWDKLQRALKAQINPEAFEQMRGTVSFPFEASKHRRIAMKVIDFRGNEVVRVVNLGKVVYTASRR